MPLALRFSAGRVDRERDGISLGAADAHHDERPRCEDAAADADTLNAKSADDLLEPALAHAAAFDNTLQFDSDAARMVVE